jgi:hypothetical protein
MRLGKEQAAGYVEDTEADALQVPEAVAAQPDSAPSATGADDTALTVG